MNDKKFDDMINMQLAGYNSQINVDDLWTTLEPNIVLPQPIDGGWLPEFIVSLFTKKLLFLIAVVGVTSVSIFYANQILNNNNNNFDKQNLTPLSLEENASNEKDSNFKEEDLEEKALELNTNDINEVKELKEDKKLEKESKEDLKKEIEREVEKEIEDFERKGLEVKSETVPTIKKVKENKLKLMDENKSQEIVTITKHNKKDNVLNVKQEKIVKEEVVSIARDESLPLYKFEDKNEISSNNSKLNFNGELEKSISSIKVVKEANEKPTIQKSYPNLLELNSLNSKSILFKNESQETATADKVELLEVQDCPTFKQTVFKNFVEPFAGVAVSPAVLSQKSNELGSSLVSVRDSSESTLETFNTGVLVGAHHKKRNFAVKTGFNFSRIAERLDYETALVTVDSIPNSIVRYIVTLDNDTTAVIGTVVETTTTISKQKLFNNYRMFDIPVIFEYNFIDPLAQQQLYFNLQAGINANVKLSATGNVLDTMQNFLNLEDVTRNQLGLSYFASAGVNFVYNKSFVVQAAPYVKVIPKSITREDYAINQRYNMYGVNFSTRWYFTR